MHTTFRRGLHGALLAALAFGANASMVTQGQFDADQSGAATYTIPIQVAPGTAGMQPQLALAYSSQAGNGSLGVGWNLSGLSAITRCPRSVGTDGVRGSVNLNANDRFCLDGQRLIAAAGSADGGNGVVHRPEIESFSKVVSYGSAGSGPAWFRVWTKSGQILEFGSTEDSRIEASGSPSVRVWALSKVQDSKGNYFTVTYAEHNSLGFYWPSRIDYTANGTTGLAANNSVVFTWEARGDALLRYDGPAPVHQTHRLVRIENRVGANTVRSYVPSYDNNGAAGAYRLMSVTECGASTCKPGLTFAWQSAGAGGLPPTRTTTGFGGMPGYSQEGSFGYVDVNGDGKSDFCRLEGDNGTYYMMCTVNMGAGAAQQNVVTTGFNEGPGYRNHGTRGFVDVNGDGKVDFCRLEGPGASGYYIMCTTNLATGGAQQNIVTTGFNSGPGYGNDGSRGYADVNGDGRADFCRLEGDNGNYYILCTINLGTGGAQQNIATTGFNSGPGYGNEGTRAYVDVNADGMADFCRLEGDNGNYYILCTTNLGTGGGQQNVATSGFNSGPGYGNAGTRAYVDVNGDGRADLCRLEGDNGNYYIQCTVNLGAGGPQRVIQTTGFNSGPGYGNAGTRAYADVNGDGMADFCRLEGGDGNYYLMCTVNLGYGGAQRYVVATGFNSGPGHDHVPTRGYSDVNGDGKADFCRLEGGPGNYYIMCAQLDGHDQLPDRLIVVRNGLGAETRITYKPLTDSSVYTKGTGAVYPRVDLQLPIHVVSSVSVSDGVGGNDVTNYRYGELRSEANGRGLLGFRYVESTHASTGIFSRTEYRQDWPFIGMPYQVHKRLNGVMLSLADNTYDCFDHVSGSCNVAPGRRYFPYVSRSVQQSGDLNGKTLPTITTSTQYDYWGNATRVEVSTSDGFGKTTVNTYLNDDTQWFLGRLLRSTVTSTAP